MTDPALVQAARQLVEKLGASLLAGRSPAILRIIEEEMAAFGSEQRAAEREHVEQLRAALMEHACIEKPERGFTKERYPNHSCWAALRAARPEGT